MGGKTPKQGLVQMVPLLMQTHQYPTHRNMPPLGSRLQSHPATHSLAHTTTVLQYLANGKKKKRDDFVCSEKSEVGLEVSGKTEHPKFSLGYRVRKGAKSGTEMGCSRASWLPSC